ncbi:hypothetical protein [Shewanella maritima]|uniref:hypothetical protein n=1 Tax=Shewanella maritima TaxID=2520507 RepID=UPI003736C88F
MKLRMMLYAVSLCAYTNTSVFASNTVDTALNTEKYSLVDRHHVSMTYQGVMYTPESISLGNANSISTGFLVTHRSVGFTGFRSSSFKEVDPYPNITDPDEHHITFSGDVTARFKINDDGTYTSLSDLSYTLEKQVNGQLLLTTADGTELLYTKPEKLAGHNLPSGKIIHALAPNGFKKTFRLREEAGQRVTIEETNTGYGIYTDTASVVIDGTTSYIDNIIGLNLSKLKCYSQGCADDKWPKLTLSSRPHPSNPGPSNRIQTITDPDGVETEFHRIIPDLSYTDIYGNVTTNGFQFLTKIVSPGGKTIEYEYKYDIYDDQKFLGGADVTQYKVELNRAYSGNDNIGYDFNNIVSAYGLSKASSGGYQSFNYADFDLDRGTPEKIDTWNTTIVFSEDWQSQIKTYTSKDKSTASSFSYEYDDRGNITKITKDGVYSREAEYPSACSSTNRKYCNKPIWTSNWSSNGVYHKTNYQYYPAHGGIKKVTHPDNSVEHFYYKKYFAQYLKSNGQLANYLDGIYLLDYQTQCHFSKSETCSSDQITTSYSYEPYNLNLSSVTTVDSSSSHKLCYQYDDLGRQISEYPLPSSGQCL